MEKRGSVCGFPTLGSRCTDMQISYRWVYGFLIVGFRGIGWARLFYDLKTVLLYAAGPRAGLMQVLVQVRAHSGSCSAFSAAAGSLLLSPIYTRACPPTTHYTVCDTGYHTPSIVTEEIPCDRRVANASQQKHSLYRTLQIPCSCATLLSS